MRKMIFAVAILSLSAFATSCKNGVESTAQTNNDSIDLAERVLVSYKDSLTASFNDSDGVKTSFSVTYPKKTSKALNDSINAWIFREVLVDQEGKMLAKEGAGFKDNVRTALQSLFANDSVEARNQMADNKKYEVENPWPMTITQEFTVTTDYQDASYVTMTSNGYYDYSYAAHPSCTAFSATFRRSDNHLMGWDLVSGYTRDELVSLLKSGLKKYLDVSSDEDLRSCLLDMDKDTFDHKFPMPVNPPYKLKDGIHFTYQQYEIAAYACGMPDVVIPEKMK